MRSLDNDLVQYTWSPYKKRKFGPKRTPNGNMWRQGEDGQLQTKKRGFRRNQSIQYLELQYSASRTVRKQNQKKKHLFELPGRWCFVVADLANKELVVLIRSSFGKVTKAENKYDWQEELIGSKKIRKANT